MIIKKTWLGRIRLLYRLLIGLAVGISVGLLGVVWLLRLLITFNALFGQVLAFSVPLIILALITSSIIEFGSSSKKMLGFTAVVSLISSMSVGIVAFFIVNSVFPEILSNMDSGSFDKIQTLKPYLKINIPPLFSATSAMVFSFILGIGLVSSGPSTLSSSIHDFRKIIYGFLSKVVIPFLPLYVAGAFASMTYSNQSSAVLLAFPKVILVSYAIQLLVISVYFLVAGIVNKRNPLKLIKIMLPAYFTATGTGSSMAAMPVTLECIKKLGVKREVSEFVALFVLIFICPGL